MRTMYTLLLRFYLITILLQECAQRLTDAEALARRAHEEYSDWLGTPFAAYILYSSMCVSRAPGTYMAADWAHLWSQTAYRCIRGSRRALADDAGRAQLPLRRCRGAGREDIMYRRSATLNTC